jgi:hypothetical protein
MRSILGASKKPHAGLGGEDFAYFVTPDAGINPYGSALAARRQ